MPIYEYQCEKCRKMTSVLTTRVSKKVDAVCAHCGGKKMRRLMSRFAMPRSEESRMDSLADPSELRDLDENAVGELVAVRVVDDLEVVEVKQDQSEGPAVTPRPAYRLV